MALHLETAAINSAFDFMKSEIYDINTNATFELYSDTTLIDSFTRNIYNDFTAGSGTFYYSNGTTSPLVFTVAPGVSDVDRIKLKGNFPVGGEQLISEWVLSSTPTDYRPDFPNGGTLKLGQYIMSIMTEV